MGSGCVAQLVERSLLIPEVRGLNPVISKYLFILNISLLSTVYWKDKNKEKEAGNGSFKKNNTEKMQERCRIANMENTFCEKLVFVGSMELARVLRHRHRGGHLHEDVDDDGKRTMKEMIY